jgi:hypothetical protein
MAHVITGAKAFIRLSGETIAFAAGVSVTQENRLEEIPQLDSLEVAEYAENGHRCTVTVNTIKLASTASLAGQKIANSARFYSLDPADEVRKILLQPELIIEIVESVDVKNSQGQVVDVAESLIYLAEGCKFEGGTGQLDARGVWQGSWTFKCRRGTGI